MSEAEFIRDFPRGRERPALSGVFRSTPEDFYVEECLSVDLQEAGEHVWLWLEKRGQNTAYVAKALAKFAGVREMDVGYAGLKDRHAVTRQWFSIYLAQRPEPIWSDFDLADCQILHRGRQQKKLRRGEHAGNLFRLRLRQLTNLEQAEDILADIKASGFPNYFGEQRFGRDMANLHRGLQYFRGEIKASRSQRGFFLSAARAYLFNLNLAKAVQSGTWSQAGAAAPLYGDLDPARDHLNDAEKIILDAHPVFAEAFYRHRLKFERRAMKVLPEAMSWMIEPDMLTLTFSLPSGVFATSLLNELGSFRDLAAIQRET